MQFGVCGGMTVAEAAARESYEYVEMTVPALLKPQEPEEAFLATLEASRAVDIAFSVANCFVPGELKITGPDVDAEALRNYVTTTMQRAERAGVEIVVFGSGGARRVPEEFDRQAAHEQLVAFCRLVAPLAHDHGVTVAVEPLNIDECNVLNTVAECAKLVEAVAHPGVRLLVDAYHLMHDHDSYSDIIQYGDLLAHVHIATVPNRKPPGVEPCDFSPFFLALKKAGYSGRVSVEAGLQDPAAELPLALSVMRNFTGEHGPR